MKMYMLQIIRIFSYIVRCTYVDTYMIFSISCIFVLSRFVSSRLVPFRSVPFRPVSSRLVSSRLVLSVSSRPVLSVPSRPVPSRPSRLVQSCPGPFRPVPSRLVSFRLVSSRLVSYRLVPFRFFSPVILTEYHSILSAQKSSYPFNILSFLHFSFSVAHSFLCSFDFRVRKYLSRFVSVRNYNNETNERRD